MPYLFSNGHKMMDCPKFVEMQKMFQGKYASNSQGKVVDEVKTIIVDVNVINVNVVTKSKITKYQVFQEKEPRTNKTITDWEKEENLKESMVKTIQELQKAQTTNKGSFKSIVGWNTMWLSMFDTTPSIEPSKFQAFVVS